MQYANEVYIQLIRSACVKIAYAGKTILVDPMLSPKGALEPFAGKERNPTAELPLPMADIVGGLDAVLVSHTHSDHFDQAAMDALPKGLAVFVQPASEKAIEKAGFSDVRPVRESLDWEGIRIDRTGGRHGIGLVSLAMGKVSGFTLSAPGYPTIYIAGDSVLEGEVRQAIERRRPDIVITNSGGAVVGGSNRILMDAEETIEVARLAPAATIVAVHLEALDHCRVSRAALREAADDAGLGHRFIIPQDGETLSFPAAK